MRKGTNAKKIFHNKYIKENLPNKTTLKTFKMIARAIIKTIDFGIDILLNIKKQIYFKRNLSVETKRIFLYSGEPGSLSSISNTP